MRWGAKFALCHPSSPVFVLFVSFGGSSSRGAAMDAGSTLTPTVVWLLGARCVTGPTLCCANGAGLLPSLRGRSAAHDATMSAPAPASRTGWDKRSDLHGNGCLLIVCRLSVGPFVCCFCVFFYTQQ